MRGEKIDFQGRSRCFIGDGKGAKKTARGSSDSQSDNVIMENTDRIGPLPYRLPEKENLISKTKRRKKDGRDNF